MAALEDESKQIIGIYGFGGVGKTTLAMEVAVRVKTGLFDDVSFITVSQTVDVDKIKKETENASKRIMNGDKILIILDDVWETLNLQELCIPCGSKHKNCKILLTSRRQDVCEQMNAQSICVNSLPTKEAWILFKRVAGERVETDAELKPIAEQVATECGGLPLLIQVVGSTLKNKSISSWNSALSRLKKPAPSEIDPYIRNAFTRLQLSYDYLESEDTKSCFLLCSMFPEDAAIWVELLIYYMVGLHKFDDLESMEDARDRVQNAVNMLTSSCLLLNNKWEGTTRMHDVVRDVALLIASKGENKYLVKAGKGLKEWLPLPTDRGLIKSTGISLMKNSISKLPDYEVHLPSLEIFLVNGNDRLEMISDEFIEGMKEVKVLDMMICNIKRLPQSMKLLTKLRMLNLIRNESLNEISILGEMCDLEILRLNFTGITKIPQEIGRLVNLRRLEVTGCDNLINVAPGVISRLQRLEELIIDFSRMSEGVSDCIVEIMKLSNLMYLELMVNSIDLIPEGFNVENLKGFHIIIGGRDLVDPVLIRTCSYSKRYLHIGNDCLVIPLLKRLKKLIEVSRPITFLNGIENLNNIMPTLCDEGFNKLEDIKMHLSPNVSCLVDDSTRCNGDERETKEKFFKELKHLLLKELDKLEVLWKCPDEYISLTNLVTLEISRCNKLKRVFTASVAQSLVNLKKLKIYNCDVLEEVIWGGGGDDESGIVIVFPSLTNISLRYLPSLKRFYSGNFNTNYPSLMNIEICECVSMKIWGSGIHETPNLKTLHVNHVQVLEDEPCAINEAVAKSYNALEK